jgi:hypothetical protein
MQFHAAHAVACRDEQENPIEPQLQRRAAFLENCSRARIHMVSAMGALICLTVFEAMECGINHATLAASVAVAVPDRHDVFQTGFLRRKPIEKLADSKLTAEIIRNAGLSRALRINSDIACSSIKRAGCRFVQSVRERVEDFRPDVTVGTSDDAILAGHSLDATRYGN